MPDVGIKANVLWFRAAPAGDERLDVLRREHRHDAATVPVELA
jgi:hypothetical protein